MIESVGFVIFYQKCYVSIVFCNDVNMRSVYHERTANKNKRMESYLLLNTLYNIVRYVQYPSNKKKKSKKIAADISEGKLLANKDKNSFSIANYDISNTTH